MFASRIARVCACLFLFSAPLTAFAQDSAGSAFGESVDLSIDSAFSLVTVEATSGPIPYVSDGTPPPYNTSDSLLGVDIDANIKLISDILPATAVGVLETGILNVSTTGDDSPQSDSSASVADVDLGLLGDVLLPLVLGITADEVVSTARASGSCGAGLSASGTTSLVNASLASDLAELAGIEGALLASPPANYVLLDLNLLGGHIRIVLNEQITTGDGTTSAGITVNAIHITIDNLPLAAIITDLTGEVIISQSKASVTCAEADLSVTLSDSPDPITAGNVLTYTIDVSNAGPDSANNIQLDHVLPPGVTLGSATPDQGSCNESGGTVSCDLGNLANGDSTSITVTVTPNAPGALDSSVSVSADAHDPDPSNNADSEASTVEAAPGSADLSITITDSPDPVTAGNPLTVTLDVTNDGPDEATDTVVVYTPPPGVPITSVTPSQGTCDVGPTTITCDLGSVPNGGTPDIVVVMTPTLPGTLDHEATVSSAVADPTPDNNADNESSLVEVVPNASADLSLSKTDDADPVVVGQPLTYTLDISNAGPDDTGSVVVTDTLPASVDFQSATPSQGSCDFTDPDVVCYLGAITNSAGATVEIVVIPQSAGQISNTAVVSSDIDDPSPDNNSDTEDTTVDPGEADLTITKVSSVEPATVDVPFQYTITVSNAGPDDATLTEVIDTLPASLEYGSALPSQGSCDESAGTVTCALGTVASGQDATIVIEVTPTETGMLTNNAVVDSQIDDPNPDDNDVNEDTDVDTGRATFAVTKDFTDDNPAEVVVTISCNTGLPLEQSKAITEEEGVTFIVTEFDSGEMDCEITEDVPAGYIPDYFDGATNSDTSCVFEDIEGNPDFTCDIVNTPGPVDVEITKEWVFEGNASGIDTDFELVLHCNGEIVGGSKYCGPEKILGDIDVGEYSCQSFYGNGSEVFNAQVVPAYPSTSCWVEEILYDPSVEVDNGCGELTVSAGQGDSCVITNSVFFEGVPTLDKRGLAVLILTLLIFGSVGVRRLSS
ncbi:DUF11 domain-containing protein [Elongatibacter sediminis]|uniref:DUF11 domain-containing protein n=1 Tax=Elongatibacter sediminis TaxID=3119006 RepID=A0AAW9RH40_9GAMM